jgi:hypothetical protein
VRTRFVPLSAVLLLAAVLAPLPLPAEVPDSDVRESEPPDFNSHFKMLEYGSRKQW